MGHGRDGNIVLLKTVLSFASAVIYFVSFGSKHWIVDEEGERIYGLYSFCNSSVQHLCETINPGTSPGWFEVARVFAAFLIPMYAVFFFTLNPAEGLGKGKCPVFFAVMAALALLAVLVPLGVKHKDHDKMSGGQGLGWCYWTAATAGIFTFFLIPLAWQVSEIHNRKMIEEEKRKKEAEKRRKEAAEKKKKDAKKAEENTKEEEKKKKAAATKAAEEEAAKKIVEEAKKNQVAPAPNPAQEVSGGDAPGGQADLSGGDAPGGQADLSDLPPVRPRPALTSRYTIHDDPAMAGHVAAPDYQAAAGGDDDGAPEPVLVPESRFSRGLLFFKNYARVAAGLEMVKKDVVQKV